MATVNAKVLLVHLDLSRDLWCLALQLMQQLLSSNRQRQMQAHLLLLPLAHPQMYKDDTACPSGTMAPELKACLHMLSTKAALSIA